MLQNVAFWSCNYYLGTTYSAASFFTPRIFREILFIKLIIMSYNIQKIMDACEFLKKFRVIESSCWSMITKTGFAVLVSISRVRKQGKPGVNNPQH
ncbi:Uncharacterized protein TCM_029588 [Theobroma cacao]|uniref:Uncharacterized protein n=1 Tax=Theobroma cacao TaxID=3641 RepID=A0A061GE50_THECC|nr:Uncharacterized protein TCM_029588 [Theobroma cacao]